MKRDGKTLLFGLITILLVVVTLEVVLDLLAMVSPRVDVVLASPFPPYPHTVPDPRLGHRPNPEYPGHDAWGFRNPGHPGSAEIVALGDSQTYGSGVAADAAWPRRLESLTGRGVYSMAYGGYGPVHSLILWDEALSLEPQIVIEAFYAGNDLFDAFDIVYNKGQSPGLRTQDLEARQRVVEAEQSEPIAHHVARLYRMGAPEDEARQEQVPRAGFLSRHSGLYGLLRRVRYEVSRDRPGPEEASRKAWADAQEFARSRPAYCEVFDAGGLRTIFTSPYRLAALDLDDPRIGEGLRISLEAMRRMSDRAADGGLRLLVLLIPTKERVFEGRWPEPSQSYRRLIDNEARLWEIVMRFLDGNGIAYVDALPALRDQLERQVQPYPVSDDGHPGPSGHLAIAQAVASFLRQELKAEPRNARGRKEP